MSFHLQFVLGHRGPGAQMIPMLVRFYVADDGSEHVHIIQPGVRDETIVGASVALRKLHAVAYGHFKNGTVPSNGNVGEISLERAREFKAMTPAAACHELGISPGAARQYRFANPETGTAA